MDQSLWPKVLETLSGKMSKPSFETWFIHTKIEICDDVILIISPNAFASDRLQVHYKEAIFNAVREVAHRAFDLEFKTDKQEIDQTIYSSDPAISKLSIEDKMHKEILERLLREDVYSDNLAMRVLNMNRGTLEKLKEQIEG